MWCSACGSGGQELVCRTCRAQLRRAPDRVLTGTPTVLVRAAFHHEGAAKVLVHRVKYEGSRKAALVLAQSMVSLIPADTVIVPVPRVWTRRWRYGVQQTDLLVSHLPAAVRSRATNVLLAPLWSSGHAGRSRSARGSVAFSTRTPSRSGGHAVLIDDVVTTGATLRSAAHELFLVGFRQVSAVTATTSTEVTSL